MATAYKSFYFYMIVLCGHLIAQELTSPCPDVFLYQQRDDSTDRWYGLVNVKPKTHIVGVTLTLTLDSPAKVLGNLLGRVVTRNNREFTITNEYIRLSPTSPYLMRFYVGLNIARPIPKLIKIQQNNEVICSDDIEMNKLPDTAFTSEFDDSLDGTIQLEEEPEIHDEIQCGTVAAQAIPLIIDGNSTKVGQYPWHAAIFHWDKYICGGSLITKQYVITAARCLINRTTSATLHSSVFTVKLGKHFLKRNSSNDQIFEVSEVIKHPMFNSKIFSNNIGLLKLKQPAVFNDFVRPVCLWKGNIDYELIVGKNGTIVGWGITNIAFNSDELKEARMFFASDQDCFKLSALGPTKKSYCAKALTGSSCAADSGGGMVYLDESSGRKIYYLRGIVSHRARICLDYEVHTDAAKYLDFIKANTEEIPFIFET